MNTEQQNIIDLLIKGENIFMTAPAGHGKSRVITELKNNFIGKDIYITSTTGISALNIEGITLHSFMGIGLGDSDESVLYNMVSRRVDLVKKLQSNFLLVIDEASMLSDKLFNKIDYIFKRLRRNNKVFGGVQVLLSSDHLQLEPINESTFLSNPLLSEFKIIELKVNHRQQGDKLFQSLLGNLRLNKLTKEDYELLKNKTNSNIDDTSSIKLYCTNKEVLIENEIYLESNKNKEFIYNAAFSGKNKVYVKDLEKQFEARGIKKIILKKDLSVMLTRNHNSLGLVNGSMGIIIGFSESNLPIVSFTHDRDSNDITVVISPVKWELNVNNKLVASATQIPLILGYAFTIHKIQGQTLDNAFIDLKNCFCNHQAYVALSRVKTLNGITLCNFKNIKVNQKTVEFYNNLNENK